jgi:hypothetical protein
MIYVDTNRNLLKQLTACEFYLRKYLFLLQIKGSFAFLIFRKLKYLGFDPGYTGSNKRYRNR